MSSPVETLAVAATAEGLDSRGATLLRDGSNTLFELPGDVVARVGRHGTCATASKEVRVARWLTGTGLPVVRPIDGVRQPTVVCGRPVTWWHRLPTHRSGTTAELGAALRALHALEPPTGIELPVLDPFRGLDPRLRGATILGDDDQRWLTEQVTELRARYRHCFLREQRQLVHGDAWQGNLAVTESGRAVLLDLEAVAWGNPDWDLIQVAVDYTDFDRLSVEDYRAFVVSYGGRDVTTTSGFRTLADIQELRWLAFVLSKADTRPGARDEARHRVACLSGRAPKPWIWNAF